MPFSKHSLADRRTLLCHLKKPGAVSRLVGLPFFPPALGPALPRPPVLAVRVAVDRSRARNRDVLFFEGVNEGRVVHQLDSFPASEDQGVFAGIAGKADR